jgi:hypothetical protein
MCQNEGILDASGLDGMQAKRLLEEISALRKALKKPPFHFERSETQIRC